MKTLVLVLAFLIVAIWSFPLSPPMRQFVVTSGVGYRLNPMGGGEEALHRGVDLVGPAGCAILAAASGTVVEHWPAPGTPHPKGGVFRGHPTFGSFIVLDHGNGVFSLYGHMSKTFVHTGDKIAAGQIIGRQGRTGDATGEHLHFEIVVNPMLFFGRPLGLEEVARRGLLR